MALSPWWRQCGSAALDLVYPPLCLGCDALPEPSTAPGPFLCDHCRSQLWARREPCCEVCGESFPTPSVEGLVCQTCRGRSFAFEFALAPYEARGVMRDLIHRFKYQRQLHLRPLLGELLAQLRDHPRLRPWIENGLAVPVPLHPRRFREREFNQAEELCQELKRRWGIPSMRALKRLRYTSTQTRFRRGQRQANLHGAFALRRGTTPLKWKERPLLLVDDVFTTGSTAHECARVLRDAGAKNVVVITLARG